MVERRTTLATRQQGILSHGRHNEVGLRPEEAEVTS
jgi:hypothetical protein